jgi:cell division protein ZapE
MGAQPIGSLLDRTPEVSQDDLLAQLVPPREFETASFANYQPDQSFESQTTARDLCELFATKPEKFLRQQKVANLYLDGGFGVGKTHLLAAIYHQAKGKKAFGSFLAFTGLIGALGFAQAVEQLKRFDLICIDEFELDDPGDTMMLSRLLSELDAVGVRFAATSNTPPNALGQGRFAAADFAREISGMAKRFLMLSIEGEDYRHRDSALQSAVLSERELFDFASSASQRGELVVRNRFQDILNHLATLHPTKYAALAARLNLLAIDQVFELQDQVAALRWVAFVDRLYEAQVQLVNSGTALTAVFSQEMVGGTYRKKYLRAISRLGAMTVSR